MRRKNTTTDLCSVDIPEPERVMLSTLHSMLTIDMNEIRSRIRAARISRGWSLAEFANHSDGAITAVAMGSYERGGRTLSTPKLLAICRVLEISLVHLLASDQELTPSQVTDRHIYDLRLVQALPQCPEKSSLLSYIRAIIQERGDWNGEVISLRKGDVENLQRIFAASEEIKSENYQAWVEYQRISLVKN
jgi:transcriptional regulator with XRE-family HTH domain